MWSFARRSYLNSASLLRSIVLVVVFCSMVSLKPWGGPKLFVVPFCANETSWVQTTRATNPARVRVSMYTAVVTTLFFTRKTAKRPPTHRLSLLSPMETKCSLVVDFSLTRIKESRRRTISPDGGVSSTPTVATYHTQQSVTIPARTILSKTQSKHKVL